MPGVPPDALAQVKRGLKGLFNRKKKDTTHQPTQSGPAPTKTTYSTPASSSGTPTTTHSHPPAPLPATAPLPFTPTTTELPTTSSPPLPAAPLPSEPDLSTRSTPAVELPHSNPSTTTTQPAHATTTTHAAAPAAAIAPAATTTGATGAPGMSATSGPLDDQLAQGYEEEGEGTPFATPMEGPKGLGTG